MPYSITREDPERDLRALRAVLSGFPAGISSSAIPALQELADSIEEQVEKIDPVEALIQEFTHEATTDAAEFWTIVQWRKHHDDFTTRLSEVLRIGVGEAKPCGGCDSLEKVLKILEGVRDASITATEKEAVERCLRALIVLPTYAGCES